MSPLIYKNQCLMKKQLVLVKCQNNLKKQIQKKKCHQKRSSMFLSKEYKKNFKLLFINKSAEHKYPYYSTASIFGIFLRQNIIWPTFIQRLKQKQDFIIYYQDIHINLWILQMLSTQDKLYLT